MGRHEEASRIAALVPKNYQERVRNAVLALPAPPQPEKRLFPIQGGPAFPWEIIRPHEAQARRNHSQSLETLARRGGLSCCEAVAVLEDRKWHRMDERTARDRLIELTRPKPDARRLANAAAYTLCNGEPGAVPGEYQKDIEDNLVSYFEEALSGPHPSAEAVREALPSAEWFGAELADIFADAPEQGFANAGAILRERLSALAPASDVAARRDALRDALKAVEDFESGLMTTIGPKSGADVLRLMLKAEAGREAQDGGGDETR